MWVAWPFAASRGPRVDGNHLGPVRHGTCSATSRWEPGRAAGSQPRRATEWPPRARVPAHPVTGEGPEPRGWWEHKGRNAPREARGPAGGNAGQLPPGRRQLQQLSYRPWTRSPRTPLLQQQRQGTGTGRRTGALPQSPRHTAPTPRWAPPHPAHTTLGPATAHHPGAPATPRHTAPEPPPHHGTPPRSPRHTAPTPRWAPPRHTTPEPTLRSSSPSPPRPHHAGPPPRHTAPEPPPHHAGPRHGTPPQSPRHTTLGPRHGTPPRSPRHTTPTPRPHHAGPPPRHTAPEPPPHHAGPPPRHTTPEPHHAGPPPRHTAPEPPPHRAHTTLGPATCRGLFPTAERAAHVSSREGGTATSCSQRSDHRQEKASELPGYLATALRTPDLGCCSDTHPPPSSSWGSSAKELSLQVIWPSAPPSTSGDPSSHLPAPPVTPAVITQLLRSSGDPGGHHPAPPVTPAVISQLLRSSGDPGGHHPAPPVTPAVITQLLRSSGDPGGHHPAPPVTPAVITQHLRSSGDPGGHHPAPPVTPAVISQLLRSSGDPGGHLPAPPVTPAVTSSSTPSDLTAQPPRGLSGEWSGSDSPSKPPEGKPPNPWTADLWPPGLRECTSVV
ncbi:uncharacterized protein [Saccopteryx leptura]|uniref:uncharacterized protein n=1 Tax=Saccopteryx leptura TaxID=249018 RepID=UPI00339CE79F